MESKLNKHCQNASSNRKGSMTTLGQVQYISKDSAEHEMGMYDITRPGPEDRINLLKNINLLNKLSKNMLIIIMTALFTESKVGTWAI